MLDIEYIKRLNEEFLKGILEDRRIMHQYPELSFEEKWTSNYISNRLDEMGIIWQNCGGYGIVADIDGFSKDGGVVALRADFDALPIQELNDVSYQSTNKGKMHACGHDAHTASLLGVARILLHMKEYFHGTVRLLFQPAEEKFPGGAKNMVEHGSLQKPNVQTVMAQHVMPELESGKIGLKSGYYAAANDEVTIRVKGVGGHGSQPQALIDPVVVAAQIILSLQQVVSRVAEPTQPTVLSFGRVEALGAHNIIPEEVLILGTLRTLDKEWRKVAHAKIKTIATGIASSFGAGCDVEIKGFPNVYNDTILTSEVKEWAKEYLGEENVVDLDYWMAGEDFGEFAKEIPGCYYRIGSGNKGKGITAPLHSPRFDIDELPVLAMGSGLMVYIALKKLGN